MATKTLINWTSLLGAIVHFHSILRESLYANREDLDQTPRSVAFFLGLHRLPMCLIKGRYADMDLFGIIVIMYATLLWTS